LAQFSKDEENSPGAAEHVFGGSLVVHDHIHRTEIRSDGMALKNFRRHWALQRGETELVGVVTMQDELDESVAETADSVVKDDRVGR
jgi:hypothetical protein